MEDDQATNPPTTPPPSTDAPSEPKHYCSVPDLLGMKDWYDGRFREVCKEHDQHYINRDTHKLAADYKFAKRLVQRSWWNLPLAVLSFLAMQTPIGFWYWFTD